MTNYLIKITQIGGKRKNPIVYYVGCSTKSNLEEMLLKEGFTRTQHKTVPTFIKNFKERSETFKNKATIHPINELDSFTGW